MKILIAPDKFKGSLLAPGVCDAVADALHELDPTFEITKVPLADGGEGTFEILLDSSRGRIKKKSVHDPLMRPLLAEYGLSNDGTTAYIEMAKASGLQLLKENERNPLQTSTIGTGELIVDALNEGAVNIILGIGGSATNDAGIGMAHALGFRFLTKQSEILSPVGGSLADIDSIDDTNIHVHLRKANFIVLCDVVNPLYGPQGAAFIYAPQKGATPEQAIMLDKGLKHFSDLALLAYKVDLNFTGAGAAGGLGAGAKLFLNATFQRGIDYISELTGLEYKIKNCDAVITGEGKVDEQTFSGKVVDHVVKMANQYKKPVTILCGQCSLGREYLSKREIKKIITLAKNPVEAEQAMKKTLQAIKSKIRAEFS